MNVTTPDPDDVDAIADLWVALADEQRELGSYIEADENRNTIRELVARHLVTDDVLVARVDGDVVGFVMFGVATGAYEETVTRGVVHNLYVRPANRDAGVGSALLSAAEDALVESGVAAVTLEAMADNEDARRFYRRHGYDRHRIELAKSVESDTHSKE